MKTLISWWLSGKSATTLWPVDLKSHRLSGKEMHFYFWLLTEALERNKCEGDITCVQ